MEQVDKQMLALERQYLAEIQEQNKLLREISNSESFQTWLLATPELSLDDKAELGSKLNTTVGYASDFEKYIGNFQGNITRAFTAINEARRILAFLYDDLDSTYRYYQKEEKNIKNPQILAFIRDFKKWKGEE